MFSAVIHRIQSVFQPHDFQKSLGWLDTLPEMEEIDILIETRQQLSKIHFESIYEAKYQIEMVLQIDKNTYRCARRETHKYLTTLRINKKLESSIYNATYLYYRQLYIAYTQFLACYQGQVKVVLPDDKINLILCRLLNATFAMAKWRYFDDQPAPSGTWSLVHNVIRLAENLAIMNKSIFMYSFDKKETSIAAILKQGFMMDTLHKGNYSRLQIQLTEQVLKTWASNPLILNKYRQDKVQFFISLDGDKGPERIRAIEKYAEYRFWKTTRIVDKIEAYLCAYATQKSLTEFGLDKAAPPSVIIKLFKKLRAEWCVEGFERQRRKEERNKNNKLLSVSHGLEGICARLDSIDSHLMLSRPEYNQVNFDYKLAQQRRINTVAGINYRNIGSENWWMVDESKSGLAADLGKEVSHWIEPGELVGYTTVDDKNSLALAEIKSVRKQVNGTYRVGLELLGAGAESIKISRVDLDNEVEIHSGYFVNDSEVSFNQWSEFSGVLVTNTSGLQRPSLVIPRKEYKRGSQYVIKLNGEDKLIQATILLRKQRDWVSFAINI